MSNYYIEFKKWNKNIFRKMQKTENIEKENAFSFQWSSFKLNAYCNQEEEGKSGPLSLGMLGTWIWNNGCLT